MILSDGERAHTGQPGLVTYGTTLEYPDRVRIEGTVLPNVFEPLGLQTYGGHVLNLHDTGMAKLRTN